MKLNSGLLVCAVAAACVALAAAHGDEYGSYGYGYYGGSYGGYGGPEDKGHMPGEELPGPVACYPDGAWRNGADLTFVNAGCGADWLYDYKEYDILCPEGTFVSEVSQHEAVTLYGFRGVVQIYVTCSDGTMYMPLPDKVFYGADDLSIVSYRSDKGFTAVDGSAGCQIDAMAWVEGANAQGKLITCPREGQVVSGLRIGAGELLNSIRFCCA